MPGRGLKKKEIFIMYLKRGMIGSKAVAWAAFLATQGYNCGYPPEIFGPKMFQATKDFQTKHGLTSDGVVWEATTGKAVELGFEMPANKAVPETDGVTMEQLAYIMKTAKRATIEKHLPFVNSCMKKFDINTPLRKQHFLAQVGHESMSLKYMHEIASGAAYEGRGDLGNTQPGDGKKFRGHGPIQLTGRANHTAYFKYIGRPELVNNPEILESDMELAWGASGWYWTPFRKINRFADKDDVKMVTKLVNGGLNGFSDRQQYLMRAKEVITE